MDQGVTRLERQREVAETGLRTTPDTETETAPETGPSPRRGRSWRLYGAILAALVVLGGGGWWLYQQFTHVIVNDARIAADVVAISSRVPGWITAVDVIAGDAAEKGRVLVRIDERESRLRVQAFDAQLAGSSAAGRKSRPESR